MKKFLAVVLLAASYFGVSIIACSSAVTEPNYEVRVDTVVVVDTLYLTEVDTVFVTQVDTVTVTDTLFVTDTVFVTDTLFVTDTVTVTDTVPSIPFDSIAFWGEKISAAGTGGSWPYKKGMSAVLRWEEHPTDVTVEVLSARRPSSSVDYSHLIEEPREIDRSRWVFESSTAMNDNWYILTIRVSRPDWIYPLILQTAVCWRNQYYSTTEDPRQTECGPLHH